MNAYIYTGISRISSTQTFAQYKEAESKEDHRAVNKNGDLLDYETLELRVHPPNIQVKVEDNETLITLDSANRPGTLIEVRHRSAACRTRLLALKTTAAARRARRGTLLATFVSHRRRAQRLRGRRACAAARLVLQRLIFAHAGKLRRQKRCLPR